MKTNLSAIFSPDSEVGRSLSSSQDGQLRLPFPCGDDSSRKGKTMTTDDDVNEGIDEDALDDYLSPCTHCGDGECDGECLEEEVGDYLDQFYPEVKK